VKLRWGLRQSGEDLERELASRARLSSFPFISGDTFREMCDLVVDESGISHTEWQPGDQIFVATKYVELLLDLARDARRAQIAATMKVLIHNGDRLPNNDTLRELSQRFAKVWAVNTTDALRDLGIGALPIGLENLHWGRNGLLENFPLPIQGESLFDVADRETLIFGSFRTVTNPPEREPLRAALRERGARWHEPSGKVTTYISEMRRAVFVPSPRGNGLDCHRTWEALYLGAIPVVTAGTLAPELVRGLPILEVPDWQAFLEYADDELRILAATLAPMSRERAYMPYWCALLASDPQGRGRGEVDRGSRLGS
jgi:hypothetical protein